MSVNFDVKVLHELLTDAQVSAIIGQYLGPGGPGPEERYRLFGEQLNAKRFVVPVAGVQGAGKSTFLNAIAFGYPVLPIDADETTAVPVEISWAKKPDGMAIVHFKNGKIERVQASEAELKRFVHNGINTGNRLEVDRIVLHSDCPILETGLVLVDLPGTGTLTETNIETTRKYLMEAVGVIFLLRTVPPMTRSDGVFVAANWARLPLAIFVLNRWTDERDEEVADGLEYTTDRLEQIAQENHIRIVKRPSVDVVVAYRALEGRLKGDDRLLEQSGMNAFLSGLGEVTQGWTGLVRIGIHEAFQGDIEGAIEILAQQRENLSADRAAIEARMASEEERFKDYIQKLQNHLDESDADGKEFVRDLGSRVDAWAKNARPTLRNNMRTKMRGGIVDGERLNAAFHDEQGEEADRIYKEVQEQILTFQDRLRERFLDFPSWKTLHRTDFREIVNRPGKKKWENILPPIGNMGGGIAGGYAGAAATAWILAKAGAEGGAIAGAPAGPIGSAIGLAVGAIAGALLGLWLGSKAKKAVTKKRADAAEPEIFEAIDRFLNKTREDLLTQLNVVATGIEDCLTNWKNEQHCQYEAQRSQTMKDLQATQAEKKARLKQLNADEAVLQSALCRLDRVTP